MSLAISLWERRDASMDKASYIRISPDSTKARCTLGVIVVVYIFMTL